jgi:hypothetical protein
MRTTEHTVAIHAPAATVWQILTAMDRHGPLNAHRDSPRG